MACMKPATCYLVHLLEKSESVVYVPVEMPHKRSRRLKNHGELVNLAEKSPDSEDIFMEDIVSCNYPNSPDDLKDLCLHDFVANYEPRKPTNVSFLQMWNAVPTMLGCRPC